jgi:hypothetical protein
LAVAFATEKTPCGTALEGPLEELAAMRAMMDSPEANPTTSLKGSPSREDTQISTWKRGKAP